MTLTLSHLLAAHNSVCVGAKDTKWCGCGNPALAWLFVRDALAATLTDDRWKFWAAFPPGSGEILSAALHDMDLLEHGGAFTSAWMTQRGKVVLACLRDATEEQIDALSNELNGHYIEGECPNCALVREFDAEAAP